jgi:hypothetical protein
MYIQKIRLSVQRFKEKYSFLPGDFPYAARDIRSDLPNGSGTGVLSGNPFSADTSAGRFWVHLNAANGSKELSTSILNFGDGLIESGCGGGYTVISNPIESMPGHWIVLGSKANETSGEGVLLTPEQAQYIDKK